MKIFPAIDIIDGCVVRLTVGDYNQKTTYGTSPLETAKHFESLGAENIHIVDLDAAKDGSNKNEKIISDIAEKTSLFVETGGGIRDISKIERYSDAGVKRVIIGTAAVKNPEFLSEAVEKFGEMIAVGVDAKDEMVAVSGWLDVTKVNSFDFCRSLREKNVSTVIYTDISKDGKLQGTNLEAYKRLKTIEGLNVIASGGISSMKDITDLLSIDCYGCIIGKAIYENRLDLSEVLSLAKEKK